MSGPSRRTGRIATPMMRIAAPVAIAICLTGLGLELAGVRTAFGGQAPPPRLPDAASSRTEESHPAEAASKTPEQAAPAATVDKGSSAPDGSPQGARPTSAAPGQSGPQHPTVSTPTPTSKAKTNLAKLADLRAETVKRLEAIDAANVDPAAKAGGTASQDARTPEETKALRELLRARLNWMADYEKAEKEYHQAAGAKPDEAKAKLKAELEKMNKQLEQARKSPPELLTPLFRGPVQKVDDAARTEMKDAIAATKNDLAECAAKRNEAQEEATKTNKAQAGLRVERDKLSQRVAALKAKVGEPAPTPAKGEKGATPESQRLEAERRLNLEWETQVESLRLKTLEAKIALDAKQAAASELEIQLLEAHVQLVRMTLEQMRLRFQVVSEIHEQELKRAAANEEKKAAKANDPLERHRARRSAELLQMEVQTIKFEETLTSNPRPAPEQQRKLTKEALEDFERLKQLIKDGQVTRLDAMRLNNSFRRIGPERERIIRNELATVEARVQFYNDALTEAELELIEDAHQDQFEHDAVLERLPAPRHAEAAQVFEELERKHLAILVRRRNALKDLAIRASDTLKEVTARLDVLEEEYAFVRTNIFWVRDQEPIGPDTAAQGGREITRLGKALFRLAGEAIDMRNWGRVSAEFATAAAGLVVLPLGIKRVRRGLGRRIAHDLPDPGHPPEGPVPDGSAQGAGLAGAGEVAEELT